MTEIRICPVCMKNHSVKDLEITSAGIEDGEGDDGCLPHKWVYIYCNVIDEGLEFFTDMEKSE